MRNRQRIISLALTVIAATVGAFAQTINGTVVDSNTKEPIIGAAIAVAENPRGGVISNFDGEFQVQATQFPTVITVSFTGYRTQEIDIYDNEEPVVVELVESHSFIDQVVVVGYGVQKRQQLTSSISSIKDELLSQNVTSVESLLQGAVAGINVSASSGQPGATSTIRIRGGNSITGGNEPLYVIDGFIVYNDPASTRTKASGADATLDPMSFLNPADIESIEILKDVSATAIYGTRGANGVIMITTKKGKHGRDNVSYTGTLSFGSVAKKLDFLTGKQYAELYNEIRTGEGSDDRIDVNASADEDWQSAALRSTTSQEHQLSFIGGDEKSRYNISLGYKNVEGIVLGTDQKRYVGRINYDRNVNEKFSFGVNFNGTFNKVNGLRSENGMFTPNSWVAAITHTPYNSIKNADGSYNYNPAVNSDAIYNGKVGNPISDLENIKSTTENTRVLGVGWAEYEVLPNLKAKVNIGADISNTRQSNYSPSYTSTGLANQGVASVGQTKTNIWQSEYTLNYSNTFDVHSISALAGYTAQSTDLSTFATSNYGYSNDFTGYNALGAASTTNPSSSYASVNTLQSWLGRVNYSYDSRYNATVTFRADGSSRFAKDHQWGWFPSIGASWNLDKEKFLHLGKNVDYLQLRASWGIVGNQEIGDYQYVANLSPATYILNNQRVTAYLQSNMANEDLKWETTKSYNVGISSGFFNNRLTVTLDAYYKETSDLLLNVPTESTTGFSSVLRNIGSVENKGVELEIGGTIIENKDWNWHVNVNLAHNKNEVTSLGDASQLIPDFSGIGTLQYLNPLIVRVGQPLGTFYGYKFKGLVQKGQDISKLPTQSVSTLAEGFPIYEDVDGDNKVTETDRTELGNAQPKLTYGINSTLKYKNWDFLVNISGSYGNKLFNALACRLTKGNISYNSLAVVADRWTETNPSNIVQKATNSTSIVTDDRYVEDASFLRFKNIQLGYTLPLQKYFGTGSQLRLYVSLQNFITITSYSGYDPESNRNGIDETNALYQGIDYGAYPSAKTVQLGLNFTL